MRRLLLLLLLAVTAVTAVPSTHAAIRARQGGTEYGINPIQSSIAVGPFYAYDTT